MSGGQGLEAHDDLVVVPRAPGRLIRPGALQAVDDPTSPAGLPVDLVVEAREELDALGGVSALSRLDDVTEEARARGRYH